ncbi:MAG: OadG family protein [Clostridia bacterium]|nr:OadG family protein [Clostridia bacterium]
MNKRILTRLLALVSVLALLFGMCVLGVCAAQETDALEAETTVTEQETASQKKNPTNEELGGFFSAERIKYAVLVSVQGMAMIFLVLSILWGVVALMKVFLHDIPAKKAAKQAALAKAVEVAAAPVEQPTPVAEPEEDEGEIVAAITAAIAVMLQSEEYKGQFESGFRVVSFTRKGGAWNKQN